MNKMSKSKFSVVMEFLSGAKRFYAIAILAAICSSLADMIVPQIVRIAIDDVLMDNGTHAKLPSFVLTLIEKIGGFSFLARNIWIMALAILVVAFIQVFTKYLFEVFESRASQTFMKKMRDDLYIHIGKLPFSWFMKNHTGDIIQRCTSDIDTIKSFVSEQLISMFRTVLMLVFAMIFMFRMNFELTLIALIPIPFIIYFSVVFHNKLVPRFMECDENEGKLSTIVQENLTGVRVLRAFGQEEKETDKFLKHNKFYTGLWNNVAKMMSRFWTVADCLSAFQIMMVIIFGALFCVKGTMTEGEFIAFISYNAMFIWPIQELGRMIADMSKAGVSVTRIYNIMIEEVESDSPNCICVPMNRDIVFKNVSFSFDSSSKILHNINFDIKAGTTLGILGGTGSGKSTLMLLLDKLYSLGEGQGKITIGGVDIRDIKTEYLRKNIGIVLQEPYLFSGTIEDNIGIGIDKITLEQIRKAACEACLDNTVMRFGDGYKTMVGERGVTLSGGQKQRTAIARLLSNIKPIMILDDSLSAVDTETESKIRMALNSYHGKATIILISHRIATLSSADKIIVLDKGRIAESGTHDELKTSGGIYQKIYETQNLTQNCDFLGGV